MATYELDEKVLQKYIPHGCELDLFEGRALVSIVAFCFRKTKLLGVPMPLYRDFPEINLRFYVRKRDGEGWKRGVVFIKEIIPHRLPAFLARTLFSENFVVMPVEHELNGQEIEYQWGDDNHIWGQFVDEDIKELEEGTEEHFIGENYWAFKKINETLTLEFEVEHEPWKARELDEIEVKIDFAKLYGEEIAAAIEKYGGKPRNVFYLDGNNVGVTFPRKLTI